MAAFRAVQEVFTPRTRTFFDLTFRTVNNRSVARKPERREKANERNLEDSRPGPKPLPYGMTAVDVNTTHEPAVSGRDGTSQCHPNRSHGKTGHRSVGGLNILLYDPEVDPE